MKSLSLLLLLGGSAATPLFVSAAAPQDPAPEMAAMIEKAKRYTQPGPEHAYLEKMIGTWDTELRIFAGGQAFPPERGVAVTDWAIEGRWLQTRVTGTMMGREIESITLMGYDRFKMSYVMTSVSSMDTAMVRVEGDVDPHTGALLAYGTLDEYLTGEHDKMVKYVWRPTGDDKAVVEIHDLPIGESNTKVVEITYTRRP